MMSNFNPILPPSTKIITIGNQNIGPFYWVGLTTKGIAYFAGQTFKIPVSGVLQKIKLYCSNVVGLPLANLSIYHFDEENKIWKSKITDVNKKMNSFFENQWIEFDIDVMDVNKDECFGFMLKCNGGGMMAIAECPWDKPNPYTEGKQWIGSSFDVEGKFQKDFAFAFEAEIDRSPKSKFP